MKLINRVSCTAFILALKPAKAWSEKRGIFFCASAHGEPSQGLRWALFPVVFVLHEGFFFFCSAWRRAGTSGFRLQLFISFTACILRGTQLLHQSEKRRRPVVHVQQSHDRLTTAANDLRRNRNHRLQKRCELHFHQPFLATLFLAFATILRKPQRQPRLQRPRQTRRNQIQPIAVQVVQRHTQCVHALQIAD